MPKRKSWCQNIPQKPGRPESRMLFGDALQGGYIQGSRRGARASFLKSLGGRRVGRRTVKKSGKTEKMNNTAERTPVIERLSRASFVAISVFWLRLESQGQGVGEESGARPTK